MFRTRWESVRHRKSDPKDYIIITSQHQHKFDKYRI